MKTRRDLRQRRAPQRLDHSLELLGTAATQLEERGFAVIATPLQAFLRSGSPACCLTLRLDHRSRLGNGVA